MDHVFQDRTHCRVSPSNWCKKWSLIQVAPALFPAFGFWAKDIIQSLMVCVPKDVGIFKLWTHLESLSIPVSATFWSCSFQDSNHPPNPATTVKNCGDPDLSSSLLPGRTGLSGALPFPSGVSGHL